MSTPSARPAAPSADDDARELPRATQGRALAGRTALVTGGARNIGRAIVHALAGEGAAVVVGALADLDAARKVAAEVEAGGGRALPWTCDVTDRGAVHAMVDAAVDAFGSVDILVLNASQRGQIPFLEMTPEAWKRVVGISLDGSFHLAQACVPHMVAAGWGRIVTLGGASGYVGTPGRAHSLAGKAGLVGLTRGLAVELAPHGITANCVAPGFIDTVMVASMPRAALDTVVARIPLGRLGRVAEVARCVRFLLEEDAGYITGAVITVNGGLEM